MDRIINVLIIYNSKLDPDYIVQIALLALWIVLSTLLVDIIRVFAKSVNLKCFSKLQVTPYAYVPDICFNMSFLGCVPCKKGTSHSRNYK